MRVFPWRMSDSLKPGDRVIAKTVIPIGKNRVAMPFLRVCPFVQKKTTSLTRRPNRFSVLFMRYRKTPGSVLKRCCRFITDTKK